ncbi:DivIVA domain-containing protein, partial [Streptomyces alkaliphilus]|uniref:DivIVA domain-containing protein n=1 Tax=Streptomyces alkaliphilus TaxID=1472722 RepID=UPI0011807785
MNATPGAEFDRVRRFERGYHPEQVDAHLTELTADRDALARRLAALVTAERELVEEISRAGDAREAAADLPPDRWVALGPR